MSTAVVVLITAAGAAPGSAWASMAGGLADEPSIAACYWSGASPASDAEASAAAGSASFETIDLDRLDSDIDVLLFVSEPVREIGAIARSARRVLSADPRNAMVSFLSDRDDDSCLFDPTRPGRGLPDVGSAGVDTAAINAKLARCALGTVPVSAPLGWVTAVDASLMRAFSNEHGSHDGEHSDDAATVLAAASHQFLRHGLRLLLDLDTYAPCAAPADSAHGTDTPPRGRDVPAWRAVAPPARGDLALARAQAFGLDLIIDATCVREHPNGTQAYVLSLIEHLTNQEEVRSIAALVGAGELPEHAARLEGLGGISLLRPGDIEWAGGRFADIYHRPFQTRRKPIRGPWGRWGQVAERTALTVLDLINYEVGDYRDPALWADERHSVALGVECADLVVTISEDVRHELERLGLSVPAQRVRAIPLGTDHLSESADNQRRPDGVDWPGGSRFLLVVGTDLAHKNRDLAMGAWQRLRTRHPDLKLVMVGPHAEVGSSIAAEHRLLSGDDRGVRDLGPVGSSERNWLLANAAVVLYPTSAEGFGLVPFEAAALGTACVWVPFGPLREFLPDTAGTAVSWGVPDLARAAESLLTDSALAAQSVRSVREAGSHLTWDRTAKEMVLAYFDVLRQPPRNASLLAAAERGADRLEQAHAELRALNSQRRYPGSGWRNRPTKAARRAAALLRGRPAPAAGSDRDGQTERER